MKVKRDIINNEFNVSLSEDDLRTAFQLEENFEQLMYNIVKSTHGEYIADQLFIHYDD